MASHVTRIGLLRLQAAGLLLYADSLNSPAGQAYLQLLDALLAQDGLAAAQAYGHCYRTLSALGQSWARHLGERIAIANNPFTCAAERGQPSPALLEAAIADLGVLQQLAATDLTALAPMVAAVARPLEPPLANLDDRCPAQGIVARLLTSDDWGNLLRDLIDHHRQEGSGALVSHRVFRWRAGQLQPVSEPDPIRLEQLTGFSEQQATVCRNTEFLLASQPAQNILLYGSRGTGKSSLVKALANAYGDRGLRLVEVGKGDLASLPQLLEQLQASSRRFVVFVDDLSFEEDDDSFKALKVVLEGNVTARPANVVVYATSNRRHLIREYFADRPRPSDADEIQSWDTVQEKLSFSDRFGLTLTFEAPDQDTYLAIVRHLVATAGLSLPAEELSFRARQWATRHNGRSGRSARQFVDWLIAEARCPT